MPDSTGKEDQTQADIQFFRALTAYPATALGVEISIALGLLALLGLSIGLAGKSAPGAYLLTAFALFPTVLTYAELAARTPGPGGSFRLVVPTLPGLGAFLTGWASLLGQVSAGAILALTGATYLAAVLATLLPTLSLPPQLIAIPIV
ncbi:MAG: APC family permease, partial [Anaerolineae bacterium]